MRVNVYTEEITGEVAVVEKNGFHGLRIFLKSHGDLHDTPDDDDRSAITLWGLSAVQELLFNAALVLARRPS